MKDRKTGDGLSNDIYLKAVSILRKGGVVAFPTETYYGLAVDPDNEKALQKLFEIKKRDSAKPILVLISEIAQLFRLTNRIPEHYKPLIQKLWPGPLTLIFQALPKVSPLLTGNSGTVGIRISSHPVARTLCRKWGQPLTATSANISGRSPAESAAAVHHWLGDKVDFIIDGGQAPAGHCSTILGVQGGEIKLIRSGKIDFSTILSVIKQ